MKKEMASTPMPKVTIRPRIDLGEQAPDDRRGQHGQMPIGAVARPAQVAV